MEEMAKANRLTEEKLRPISRRGRDFFKHADRDPDEVLDEFTDDVNDHVLIAAVMDFKQLASAKPIEVQVFEIWYFGVHPDKLPLPDGKHILDAATRAFPGISKSPRAKQKAAAREMIDKLLRDPTIMNDPSADRGAVASLP
jgi:hypothetical protein